MPIRKAHIVLQRGHVVNYRLRTRKEIKKYENDRCRIQKTSRAQAKKMVKPVRGADREYWLHRNSYMTIRRPAERHYVSVDDCARDERFALKA